MEFPIQSLSDNNTSQANITMNLPQPEVCQEKGIRLENLRIKAVSMLVWNSYAYYMSTNNSVCVQITHKFTIII